MPLLGASLASRPRAPLRDWSPDDVARWFAAAGGALFASRGAHAAPPSRALACAEAARANGVTGAEHVLNDGTHSPQSPTPAPLPPFAACAAEGPSAARVAVHHDLRRFSLRWLPG